MLQEQIACMWIPDVTDCTLLLQAQGHLDGTRGIQRVKGIYKPLLPRHAHFAGGVGLAHWRLQISETGCGP